MKSKHISPRISAFNISLNDKLRVTPYYRKSRAKKKKNNGTWYLRVFINGIQQGSDLYIGREPEVSKGVIRTIANEVKLKIFKGKASEVFNDYPTLNEFKEEYFEYIKNVKNLRSYKEYIPAINKFIRYIGNKIVTQYTSNDILKYQQKRLKDKVTNRPDENLSPSSVNRELCYISGLFTYAIKTQNYFNINPVSLVDKSKEPEPTQDIITPEEEKLIIENLTYETRHLIPIFKFMMNTGIRISNVLHLKWEMVNLENHIVTIPSNKTKNKKLLNVPLNSDMVQMLRMQKLKTSYQEYVFLHSKGEHYKDSGYVLKSLKKACKRAGIEKKIHNHSYRHSFATRCIEASGNIFAVTKLLDHSTPNLTQRYCHPEQTLIDTVESISSFYI